MSLVVSHILTLHTFEKSGGGFFPLHILDKAQTRFFVIEILGDCFKSLWRRNNKFTNKHWKNNDNKEISP